MKWIGIHVRICTTLAVALLVFASSSFALSPPAVNNTSVSGSTLIIKGSNLSGGTVVVILGGTQTLAVSNTSTATQINAGPLPSGLLGTYTLDVQVGSKNNSTSTFVTIGAVGPQGPAGGTGPQGPQGPAGAGFSTAQQKGLDALLGAARVYVTNGTPQNTVSVMDAATNAGVGTVPVDQYPYALVANRSGTRVYVANYNSDTVQVIDTTLNKPVASIPVPAGSGPAAVALNPVETRLYVANLDGQTVSVVDTDTLSIVATIPSPGNPFGLASNPSGSKLYVASEPNVYVVDTATNTVTNTISVGNQPAQWSIRRPTTRST
jgi:YVTN family beta-propeller protein